MKWPLTLAFAFVFSASCKSNKNSGDETSLQPSAPQGAATTQPASNAPATGPTAATKSFASPHEHVPFSISLPDDATLQILEPGGVSDGHAVEIHSKRLGITPPKRMTIFGDWGGSCSLSDALAPFEDTDVDMLEEKETATGHVLAYEGNVPDEIWFCVETCSVQSKDNEDVRLQCEACLPSKEQMEAAMASCLSLDAEGAKPR